MPNSRNHKYYYANPYSGEMQIYVSERGDLNTLVILVYLNGTDTCEGYKITHSSQLVSIQRNLVKTGTDNGISSFAFVALNRNS